MKTKKLMLEQVFSSIDDKNIRKNVKDSPIWKDSLHWEDVSKKQKKQGGFLYTIYFDDLTPINVTSIKKINE